MVKIIIAVIIVLAISNTLMMSVMERTAEIGTSMALGVKRNAILSQFGIEGTYLGLLGGIVGAAAGVLGARVISAVGIPMPPPPGQSWGYLAQVLVTPATVLQNVALAVATAVVAAAYPAWKASRVEIVNALRFNK